MAALRSYFMAVHDIENNLLDILQANGIMAGGAHPITPALIHTFYIE